MIGAIVEKSAVAFSYILYNDSISSIMNKNLYPPFEMGAEAKP